MSVRPGQTIQTFVAHDTPEHNGVAHIGKSHWTDAVSYAIWIRNRMPCKALAKRQEKTPYEVLYRRKPDLSKAQWRKRGLLAGTEYRHH